mmetsp:Transcript_29934/g.85809  ORF Transcript_29934/g.85809 Transcript_29934/m.85809 type:complete len:113 (-) Transcript_29934:214-552(-)
MRWAFPQPQLRSLQVAERTTGFRLTEHCRAGVTVCHCVSDMSKLKITSGLAMMASTLPKINIRVLEGVWHLGSQRTWAFQCSNSYQRCSHRWAFRCNQRGSHRGCHRWYSLS